MKPRSIALIDLSYIFKKAWHTAPAEKSPRQRAEMAAEAIARLENGVDHIILCRDAGPYDRTTVYPEYKAKRPEIEPEEKAQRVWFIEEMKRRGYPVAWKQGAEADDVIATLARRYSEWCEDVRIVGSDKDMAQCLTDRVRQFIPPIGDKDWEIRDVEAATKKFKVAPHLMTFYQGLLGDASDNIPGVRGIGDVNAARIANTYGTFLELQLTLARNPSAEKPAIVKALSEQWDKLLLSIKLATLDNNLDLDAEALLVRSEAKPEPPRKNSMDLDREPPPPGTSTNDGVDFEEAMRLYKETRPVINAALDARERERAEEEEWLERERFEAKERAAKAAEVAKHVTTAAEPQPLRQALEDAARLREWASKTADPNKPFVPRKAEPRPEPPPRQSPAAIVVPTATHSKYGIVTADLQPLDLEAAYVIAKWLFDGGLYKSFKNEAQIFTIMMRAKELKLGVTAALGGFHIIEGKPSASADLIRALAERDPNFEYLMPLEMSATKAVWEGKHKQHPRPVQFTYTIEEARKAGLAKAENYGGRGNWDARPQDMLVKTAGSKLARLLWPGATLGLYCPEEFGQTDLDLMREAA